LNVKINFNQNELRNTRFVEIYFIKFGGVSVQLRDILKRSENQLLYHRLMTIIDESASSYLRGLGKNDFYHSKEIEKILNRLIPNNIKTNEDYFTHGEIFLLLIAVYLHDIGRKTTECYHALESYNEIRNNYVAYKLTKFEGDAVAQICAAHARESDYPISSCDSNYGISELCPSRPMNLQILGALLRLADELDNAYPRTKGILGQDQHVRKVIRDINPRFEHGIIEIQSSPESSDDYKHLDELVKFTQTRLDETISYIKLAGLNYYLIRHVPSKLGNIEFPAYISENKQHQLWNQIQQLNEQQRPLKEWLAPLHMLTEIDPDDDDAIYMLGIIYTEVDDMENAIKYLKKIVRYSINDELVKKAIEKLQNIIN